MRRVWQVFRRNLRRGLVAFLILVVAGGAWSWWRGGRGAQAVVYATGTAQVADVVVAVTGSGPLQAARSQELRAEVGATVRAVAVQAGREVRAGEVLVELENETLVLQLRQAELNLQVARLELDQLLGADAGRDPASGAASALVVRAPQGGRLTEVRVRPGDAVRAGDTLARLVDDTALSGTIRVPPALLANADPGTPVTLRVAGFDGEIPAMVAAAEAEPSLVGQTLLHTVTLTVPNPGALRPGMAIHVRLRPDLGEIEGSLESWRSETVVAAGIAGRLAQVPARAGARVAPGEILAVFDAQTGLLQVQSQQLALARQEVEVAALRRDVDKLTIRAPFDGVVTAVAVEPGARVSSNTVLLGLIQPIPLLLAIAVDELEVPRLEPGMTAGVTVEALRGIQLVGRVRDIAVVGTARDGVATYPVTIEVDPADTPGLRPGMTATATIELARREGVVAVPAEAVLVTDGQVLVRVLVDGDAQYRQIRAGLNNGVLVEVLSGIAPGDQVITGVLRQGSGGLRGGVFPVGGGFFPGQTGPGNPFRQERTPERTPTPPDGG